MRRLPIALAVLSLFAAGQATATQPTFTDVGGRFSFVIHRVCPFPLRVDGIRNKEEIIDFGDHALVVGQLFLRLTNVETGESQVYNVSGPGRYDFLSSRGFNGPLILHLRGRSFFYTLPVDPGAPIAVITSGPVHVKAGARARIRLLSPLPANAVDVCQALA